MRYIEAKLPSELDHVDLYAVTDVHRGNRQFSEKAWYSFLEAVAADPHARIAFGGDGTEMALKSSKYG